MITFIRSTAGSWIIKILFVLLIASFAVWGIGDIFRDRGPDQRVGKVGNRNITLIEVDRVFQDQLDNLRRNLDPSIDAQTAIALGALDNAAQQVVAGALIDEAVEDLDLRASDEAIARAVAQNPSLQGLDGRFDPRILRNVLASNGMTENDFLALTRRDNARQQLLAASAGAITPPSTLLDAVFSHANERRSARFIILRSEDQTDVPEPTSDALETSFEENTEAYRAPEYRRLAILTLGPDDLLDEVAVEESQIQDLYEQRIDSYDRPERRNFVQIIAQDEEMAQRIAEAAQEAGSLETALESIGEDAPSSVTLDSVTRTSMLTPELGEAGFALADGSVSAPIESPFGWHVLEVTSVTPGGVTSFAEARSELEQDLIRRAAADAVFEVANQIMDERAGGASLSNVAASFGLTLQRPAPVDSQGETDLGQPSPALPYSQALLGEAFALDEGGESLLQEQPDGGYFAVAVEEVIEPRDRAFEDVRDQVHDVVMAEARAAAVAEQADQAVALLSEGRTLDAVASDLGLEVSEASGFLRTDAGADGLPVSAIEPLFASALGDHVRASSRDGEVIAVLSAIEPVDAASQSAARDQLAEQLAGALRAELTDQLSDALSAEHPVNLNRERLIQFYMADQLGG